MSWGKKIKKQSNFQTIELHYFINKRVVYFIKILRMNLKTFSRFPRAVDEQHYILVLILRVVNTRRKIYLARNPRNPTRRLF